MKKNNLAIVINKHCDEDNAKKQWLETMSCLREDQLQSSEMVYFYIETFDPDEHHFNLDNSIDAIEPMKEAMALLEKYQEKWFETLSILDGNRSHAPNFRKWVSVCDSGTTPRACGMCQHEMKPKENVYSNGLWFLRYICEQCANIRNEENKNIKEKLKGKFD